MRPVHLTIDGLACFKDKQEVSFQGLDLFAIAGPTGAGKSTILDAIILALYGHIPRVGTHGRSEMISSSRDRLSVRLDFTLGPKRYRIARTLRRSGSHSVRLEKHDGRDFNILLADAVRPADDEIQKLLGLDVDAFKQAVVLPQGEFARFLKGKPEERRSMLRSLLCLDVYERMRAKAQQTADESRKSVAATQALLDEEYSGVSDEALTALEGRRADLARGLIDLRRRRDETRRTAAALTKWATKTLELLNAERGLKAVQERAAAIDQCRSRLDAATRATKLGSFLDEATLAIKAAAAAEKTAAAAGERSLKAERAEKDLSTLLDAASRAAIVIPLLRKQSARLHEVVGRLPEAQRLESEIGRGGQRLKDLNAAGTQSLRSLEMARHRQRQHQTALDQVQRELGESTYDAVLDGLLQNERGRALALGNARTTAQEAQKDVAKKRDDLQTIEALIAPLRAKAHAARAGADEGARAMALTGEALRRAQILNAATRLRMNLAPGEPCPVCDQIVNTVPHADLAPEVDDATRAVEAAKRNHDQMELSARAAEEGLTREQARLTAAGDHLSDLASRAAVLSTQVENAERVLRLALQGRDQGKSEESIEAWVEKQSAALSEARQTHDRARETVGTEERAIETAKTDEARVRQGIADHEVAQRDLETELDGRRSGLEGLRAAISAIAPSGDPAAEIAGLAKQIQGLEDAQSSASVAHAASLSERTQATAEASLHRDAADQAREEADSRKRRRDDAILGAGFKDEAAVRSALLDDAGTSVLSDQVREHNQARHALEQRVSALLDELEDRRVTREEVTAAERLTSQLDHETESRSGDHKALEPQIDAMKKRLDRSRVLREQLKTHERIRRIHERLATDLRSDRFQAYVLEEAFTELVQGASLRLNLLTKERYSLLFKDDFILVKDHDNAGETRISDTLSGGETFLASLSLALELSEHVQRAAGAVHLDSLFIDEGFGTLDSETLNLVSDTIQSLQAGGRMVGIITHIPELRDEFEQQILVTKDEGFSTVEVRAGLSREES